MTLTPILQQEIDQLVTKQARHAIAKELMVHVKLLRFWRRYNAEHPTDSALVAQEHERIKTINKAAAQAVLDVARQHFPRQHPAPGRLDWCLVNQHGPVCNNHAEPGSSYCHEHRAYEDVVREKY